MFVKNAREYGENPSNDGNEGVGASKEETSRQITPGVNMRSRAQSVNDAIGQKPLQIRLIRRKGEGIADFIAKNVLVKDKPEHLNDEGWRGQLYRFVNNPYVSNAINFLLLIDMVILVVSIQMEVYYLESQVEDFEKACHDGAHSLHDYGKKEQEEQEQKLEYASIAILSVFALEILLSIISEGKQFFRNPLHCLDVLVVAVSLYFEIDGHHIAAGVLVLVRTWRFLRIVHSVVEILDENEAPERDSPSSKEG